jgi:hypothetical protein
MARGGKRIGAGRKPGAKDKAAATEVASLSVLARQHTPDALATLAKVAKDGLSEAARVSARHRNPRPRLWPSDAINGAYGSRWWANQTRSQRPSR